MAVALMGPGGGGSNKEISKMKSTRLWTNANSFKNFDGNGIKGVPGSTPNIPLSNLTDYDVLAIACKLYTGSSEDNPFINYIGVKEQILNGTNNGLFILLGATGGSGGVYRNARLLSTGLCVTWSTGSLDGEHVSNDGAIPLYVDGLK